MAKPKASMPNLSNATPEFLIDELGKLAEDRKNADVTEKFYKEALKARAKKLGLEFIQGITYEGTITVSTRVTLDKAAVVAAMGEQWVLDHSKESAPIYTVKTGRLGTLGSVEEEDVAE